MNTLHTRTSLLIGLIALAALTRLLPHPPNFTPVEAMALFGGACFADRRAAFAVPFVAMFLTDLVLGFHSTMPFVYGAFALTVVMGFWLRNGGLKPLVMATLGSALLFFILTNFGTWLMQDLYPHTPAGLLACYLAALPFFHWTLLGNLVYVAALFGGMWMATRRAAGLRTA